MVLANKVAIVTGSSRGIGKAIALELASLGADIVVCARTDSEGGELPGTIAETAEKVRALGRRALAVKMDVTQEADVQAMVDQAQAEFGKIDILVNNAGLIQGPAFLESGVEDLDRFLAINVRGPYLCTRLVVPLMVEEGGGCIINISSGAARLPAPSVQATQSGGRSANTLYGLTKSALDRFSAGLAQELFPSNIAVISLHPGFTLTERLQHAMPDGVPPGAQAAEIPAEAVGVLAQDPMKYSGRIVELRDVLDSAKDD